MEKTENGIETKDFKGRLMILALVFFTDVENEIKLTNENLEELRTWADGFTSLVAQGLNKTLNYNFERELFENDLERLCQ